MDGNLMIKDAFILLVTYPHRNWHLSPIYKNELELLNRDFLMCFYNAYKLLLHLATNEVFLNLDNFLGV